MPQRKRISIIFAVGLVFLFSSPSLAENTVKTRIASIRFSGIKELKAGDIKMIMDTKFPGWLPFAKKPALDEGILKSDMKNIETYYQSNGYFDASAGYTIMKDKKKAVAKIIIGIIEGRPSLTEKITLSMTGKDKELISTLYGLVTLERGKRFRYELYETSKKNIQDRLKNNGYGTSSVAGKALVNKQAHSVDIEYSVDEGLLQRFGAVTLNGNKSVREKDITAELAFKPGDVFSNTKIDQSRENIFNLSVFRLVSVTPVISSASAIVPINIAMEEGDKRQIRLGLGYATEAKVRTSVQWSRYYLWGRPRTLTLGALYSSIEQNITGTVIQPYFIDRKNSLSVTSALDKEVVPSYTNEKISSQLQVKRNLQNNFSIFTAYNLEVNRPVDLHDTLLSDILTATPGSSYYISSLSAGLNYSFVDNPAYPSHGSTYSLYFEPATFLLGSEVDYFKGVMETHLYGTLFRELIAASRIKIGFIRPNRFTTDIPIFKRFFTGGSYSVRGYGFQQIGPKDPEGNPLGGQYLIEGNIELRFPIKGNFKGVVFVDSGDIYQSSFSFNTYSLNYGVGTGVRYITPIGPLGIDLAFPAENYRNVDLGSYHFYLTIGQGF
ncbi:MAG: BamA/TamA family outer membrane protein [Elusimicrobia bacterium]|nr:BamA/TamA family outer membrane protein [Candidatus Liberimonas magnetica]